MEPQPGATAQVLSLPTDCWPTPAAQEGYHHTLLADCPSGSQGSWRAVAGGQQGLGSGLPLTASGHDLLILMTLQPCAEPLPRPRGGVSTAARGPCGKPLPCTLCSDYWFLPPPPRLPFTLLHVSASLT